MTRSMQNVLTQKVVIPVCVILATLEMENYAVCLFTICVTVINVVFMNSMCEWPNSPVQWLTLFSQLHWRNNTCLL